MRELALFAGAGGGLLSSRLLGWRTVCAVEISDYCRRVLLQRQRDGCLDRFPIWDDSRTFDGRPWRGCVDIVTAGWSCQPTSKNGKQLGVHDERWTWPDVVRILRETGAWAFMGENVPGLLSANAGREFGVVLADLASLGFVCRWDCIPASAIGAPHARDRVWIVADATQAGREIFLRYNPRDSGTQVQQAIGPWPRTLGTRCDLVHGLEQSLGEPALLGADDGLAYRMDRLAACGEGWIPAVARAAWELLGNH